MPDESESNHRASIVSGVGASQCGVFGARAVRAGVGAFNVATDGCRKGFRRATVLGALSLSPRGLGVALGVVTDRLLGDPDNRWHPVAWFGTWAAWVEKRSYADSRAAGVAHVAATVAPVIALGCVVEAATRRRPLARALATGVATWAVVGAKSLAREGEIMADFLDAGDLESARGQLSHLCGREAATLDEGELARATVESLAENTADSVLASLFWGTVAGIPGLLGHRAVNTLDAMVGHHNDRYENFGWASAHLDDLLDLIPARLTGFLACALAGRVGGDPRHAWAMMRRDARNHPSPNGGWCESAFAGALGVRLGGRNIYPGGRVEVRGNLGDGLTPRATHARKAAKLVTAITTVAAGLSVGVTDLIRIASP